MEEKRSQPGQNYGGKEESAGSKLWRKRGVKTTEEKRSQPGQRFLTDTGKVWRVR
jgi:hypothetical protein